MGDANGARSYGVTMTPDLAASVQAQRRRWESFADAVRRLLRERIAEVAQATEEARR